MRSGTRLAPSVSGFRVSLVSLRVRLRRTGQADDPLRLRLADTPFGRDAVVEFRSRRNETVRGQLERAQALHHRGQSCCTVTYEALDLTDLAARKFPANQYGNYSLQRLKPQAAVAGRRSVAFVSAGAGPARRVRDRHRGSATSAGRRRSSAFRSRWMRSRWMPDSGRSPRRRLGVGVRLDCTIDGSSDAASIPVREPLRGGGLRPLHRSGA